MLNNDLRSHSSLAVVLFTAVFALTGSLASHAEDGNSVGIVPTGDAELRASIRDELTKMGFGVSAAEDVQDGFSSAGDLGVECSSPPDAKCIREIGRLLGLDGLVLVESSDASLAMTLISMKANVEDKKIERKASGANEVSSGVFELMAPDRLVALLSIDGELQGDVFVDDVFRGKTPLSGVRVPAGEHDVRIVDADSGEQISQKIVANVGETTTTKVTKADESTKSPTGDGGTTAGDGGDKNTPPSESDEGSSPLLWVGIGITAVGAVALLASVGVALYAESQIYDVGCVTADFGAVTNGGCAGPNATEFTPLAIGGWIGAMVSGVILLGGSGLLIAGLVSGGEEE